MFHCLVAIYIDTHQTNIFTHKKDKNGVENNLKHMC